MGKKEDHYMGFLSATLLFETHNISIAYYLSELLEEGVGDVLEI